MAGDQLRKKLLYEEEKMTIQDMNDNWECLKLRVGSSLNSIPQNCRKPFDIEMAALDEIRTSGGYVSIDGKLISDMAIETPPQERFYICLIVGDMCCEFQEEELNRTRVDIKYANLFPACIFLRIVSIAETLKRFLEPESERSIDFHYQIRKGEEDRLKDMLSSLNYYYPWFTTRFFPSEVTEGETENSEKEITRFLATAIFPLDALTAVGAGYFSVTGILSQGSFETGDRVYLTDGQKIVGSPGRIGAIWIDHKEVEHITESGQKANMELRIDIPQGSYRQLAVLKG